jgi:hypothetical protein
MKENKQPTLNEIFVEQISMLRKINPARHCNICEDQMYVGFNTTPDGTKQLTKCTCATFGPSEYQRVQDHLHNVDANVTGQLQALLNNVKQLADGQRQTYRGMLEVMEVLHRNTFWGGIKFGIGVVLMYLHDGWLFIKKGLKQLSGEKDGEKSSLQHSRDTNSNGRNNMLEMPNQRRE